MELSLEQVLTKHPTLTRHGFWTHFNPCHPREPQTESDRIVARTSLENDTEKFELVKEWLSAAPLQTVKKSKYTPNSYKLKHVCERTIGGYVSNGVLIAAAISLGIKVVQIKDTPNALVHIDYKWLDRPA